MTTKPWSQIDFLPIALIALMALTRFHHFGDILHLPDASLAVFFFAGFYRKKMLFGFLLALAALIDYVAIQGGTSGWCLSPAYAFLIPTYAVMWLAGRYCAAFETLSTLELAKSFASAALATSMAFAISNGSFYLFSGRYEDISWEQYLSRVTQYYLPYTCSALLYVLVGYVLVKLYRSLPASLKQHSSH
jgi:hypothetical protein